MQPAGLDRERIVEYCRRKLNATAVLDIAPLGEPTPGELKGYGYGKPVLVRYRCGDRQKRCVIRTMAADPFGHDRRADRTAALFFCLDTFNRIPDHVRALDAGTLDPEGRLVSAPAGEPFLVTEFAEGSLYASDLRAIRDGADLTPRDVARAEYLADYLAELHALPAPAVAYQRAIRDLVGSGEGIFGLCDAYAPADAIASPSRLKAIETLAVEWRWRLAGNSDRCRRTHGDFHPFNLLFRSHNELSVLDCSRGAAGDPADDVTCLSINYLFFGQLGDNAARGRLERLWHAFWDRYLRSSGDDGILSTVAPFFTWRALVLACPLWYPALPAQQRAQLLRFAEQLLGGRAFNPHTAPQTFYGSAA